MQSANIECWRHKLVGRSEDMFPQESFITVVGGYEPADAYLVVQFYPWFKFYFPLFLGMVMYDNEFEPKENKI